MGNGIGDEENEDDFADFMHKRTAEAPKPQRATERLPPQKQLALLDHLDDLGGQETFWE